MNIIIKRISLFALLIAFLVPMMLLSQDKIGRKAIISGIWNGKTTKYVAGEIAVKLKSGKTSSQLTPTFNKIHATIKQNFDELGWGWIELPDTSDVMPAISELQKSGAVEVAEPNFVGHAHVIPNDPNFNSQWALRNTGQSPENGTPGADIDATDAWNITTGNSNVIIAILDSGIPMLNGSLSHPDLNNTNRILLGPDETGSTSGMRDNYGHGTHVAGITGAETSNSTGIAGIAWGCKIRVTKVFTDNGGGDIQMFYKGVVDAVDYIRNNPSYKMVINFSGGFPASSAVENAVIYANTYNVTIVASAGNNFGGSLDYPAAYSSSYSNVIAVSATDQNDVIASYSSTGSQVVVSAPGGWGYLGGSNGAAKYFNGQSGGQDNRGMNIYSTEPNYQYYLQNNSDCTQTYGYLCGTSMAAPQVTGTVALLLSKNQSLVPSQIRYILQNSATKVSHMNGQNFTNEYGYGRVNAKNTVGNLFVPYIYSTIYSALSAAVSGQTIILSGSTSLTANIVLPSGVSLIIKSDASINLNGYSIVSSGGTITIESGNTMACAKLRTGGTIIGLYGTVQSAVNASSSGQSVEISCGTFNENVTINGLSNFTIFGNSSNNTTVTGTITAYSCTGLTVSSLTCFRMYFSSCNNSNFYYYNVASTSSEIGISHYYCSNFQSSGEVYNSSCGLLAYGGSGFIYSQGNFFNNYTALSVQASSNVTALNSMFCANVNYDLEAINHGYIAAYNCYYNNYSPKIRQYMGGTVYCSGANNCGPLLKKGIQAANQENLPSANQIQSNDSVTVEFSNINLSYFSVIKNINDAAKDNTISDQGTLYNEHKAAINNFKKFMKDNPNSSLANVAFATVANSYWRYKEFDEMKGFLEETISDQKLDQLKGSAERFMIEYYREINDFNSAINTADAFIKKHENDKELVCDALFGKGLILSYDLKQPEKASDCFSAIVKAYPDNKIAVLAKNELGILGKLAKDIQKENNVADKVELNISNYPNPFNPSTTINYQIPNAGYVTMKVFDILGREVATLVDEVKESGLYSATFDGSRFTSGVYFVRVTLTPQDGSKPFTKTMKIQLVK